MCSFTINRYFSVKKMYLKNKFLAVIVNCSSVRHLKMKQVHQERVYLIQYINK